ncbi:hypothetical protein NEOLI_005115 [Neolecta irregularis DAH-3]|uniref:Uncharacterized protein n=1 Tax=Neolecta irregularis (strain DAH-3) TaxID=1198029 RepID=A0A1U7LQ58_NEOID|nr:hypothetical protein NEOLI_005115 [Neolecta irregularis DAH-3]|eukprot:OLL24795.1 hypothetical protein NEOLI_005115 [Neolecta irregularis DAH-3]
MVIPLCYAVFDIQWWRDSNLQELAGQSFGNKLDFMKWLGGARVVYGVKASNAMLVADAALEQSQGSSISPSSSSLSSSIATTTPQNNSLLISTKQTFSIHQLTIESIVNVPGPTLSTANRSETLATSATPVSSLFVATLSSSNLESANSSVTLTELTSSRTEWIFDAKA